MVGCESRHARWFRSGCHPVHIVCQHLCQINSQPLSSSVLIIFFAWIERVIERVALPTAWAIQLFLLLGVLLQFFCWSISRVFVEALSVTGSTRVCLGLVMR